MGAVVRRAAAGRRARGRTVSRRRLHREVQRTRRFGRPAGVDVSEAESTEGLRVRRSLKGQRGEVAAMGEKTGGSESGDGGTGWLGTGARTFLWSARFGSRSPRRSRRLTRQFLSSHAAGPGGLGPAASPRRHTRAHGGPASKSACAAPALRLLCSRRRWSEPIAQASRAERRDTRQRRVSTSLL